MKNGGKLKPHIHKSGWLSESVYINVPQKSEQNSGSLVVYQKEEKDAVNERINFDTIINVSTGILDLFLGH